MSEHETTATKENFKLRDNVGLLIDSFQVLLQMMIDLIGKISRDAAIDPNLNVGYQLYKYDDIPGDSERIISQFLRIDALIDEAQETFLGKEMPEILSTLKDLSSKYEEKVKSLDNELAQGKSMMDKINQIMDVVARNTPWMQQNIEEEEEDM